MFYLIGLGLCDEKDITVRGLEVSLLRIFLSFLSFFTQTPRTGGQVMLSNLSRGVHEHPNGSKRETRKSQLSTFAQ